MEKKTITVNLERAQVRCFVVGDLFYDEYHTNELVRVSEFRVIRDDCGESTHILVETNRGGRLFCINDSAWVLYFPNDPHFHENDESEYNEE